MRVSSVLTAISARHPAKGKQKSNSTPGYDDMTLLANYIYECKYNIILRCLKFVLKYIKMLNVKIMIDTAIDVLYNALS